MAEVPQELEAVVSNLRSVKKKNFAIVLQAAALALDGAKSEIDADAVSDALVESGVPSEEQKPFIKSCRALITQATEQGERSPTRAPAVAFPLFHHCIYPGCVLPFCTQAVQFAWCIHLFVARLGAALFTCDDPRQTRAS
eukprot:SAG31_NODE_449_length_15539_cov_21.936658_1_plen_140_part_00